MSSPRNNRPKRRRRKREISSNNNESPSQSQEAENSSEPKFIKICKELLNQITALDDSKYFHKLISTHNKLYSDYKKINSDPISFKNIHTRLHSKPCHYNNYDEFNEDINKIFYQEKRLKNYKGNNDEMVKKRMLNAKRVENYWKTLTASYKDYGFDTITNSQQTKKKQKESKKQRKNQKVLSNIKKRVKRGNDTSSELQPPHKKQKINNNNNNNDDDDDDDDDSKKQIDDEEDDKKYTPMIKKQRNEDDDIMDIDNDSDDDISDSNYRDTPFTPFAEKSRIFNHMMGNTEELFKNIGYNTMSDPTHKIKKRLNFGDDDNNNNNNNNRNNKTDDDIFYHRRTMQTFKIKWKWNEDFRSQHEQYIDVEATRLDAAVRKFLESHPNAKILTVKHTEI